LKLDGTRVREARERLALSIEDVSAKARVSPHTWIRAEHGDEIRPSSVRSIAEYLGVEPGELIESSPVPKAEAPSPSPEGTGAEVVPQIVALMRDVEEGEPGISREGLLEITAEWLRARYSEEELRDAERQLLATYRSFDRSFDSPMWNDAEQYEAWLELWDKIRAVQLALVAVGRALAAA
jgi:transcriptional regulator with XRE-family HTH domain